MPSFRISKLQPPFFGFAHLNYRCELRDLCGGPGVAAWNRGVLARAARGQPASVPAGPVPFSPSSKRRCTERESEACGLRTTRQEPKGCATCHTCLFIPQVLILARCLLTRSSRRP